MCRTEMPELASRLLPPQLGQLVRNRDFVLLWSGSTVSFVGDGIYFIAVAWEAYRLSGSPIALGIVGVAFSVPQLLFLLAGGAISDRLDRRRVMIACSIVSGLAIGAIGLLTVVHAMALWMLWCLVVPYGISQAFFLPAWRAFIPTLVTPDSLVQANAVEQFVQLIAMGVIGPALGGAIVAEWGTGVAFVIDALTFAVAAIAMARMSRATSEKADRAGGTNPSILREVAVGVSFVRSQPWLWAGLTAAAIANIALTGPTQVLVPYIVKFHLHEGAPSLGLIFAAGGAGGISAAVYIGLKGTPRRSVSWIFSSWGMASLAVAALAVAPSVWQLMVVEFLIVGGIVMGNLVWYTLMGILVPNQLLGRVASLDAMVSFSLTPLSNGITGPVANAVGVTATLVGAGLAGGATTIFFLLWPGVRDPERKLAMRAWRHQDAGSDPPPP